MIEALKPHVRIVSALVATWALSTSCASKRGAPERTGEGEKAPVVYTTTYPMRYFAERIGRGKVLVFCPVPADHAAFLRTVNAEVIRAYQEADLIVLNGAGYEKWVTVAFLPESRIVDTAKPFEKEFIVLRDTVTHSHGPAGAHTHGGVDGHTWLDPVYARIQAEEIRKAMVRRFPAHAAEFEEGFSSLAEDLDGLDRLLADLSKQYDGRPILASHPFYNYLARRYGWNVVNIGLGLDPREMPDDATLAEVKRILKIHPARYILWETCPKDEIARRLDEELGLKSVVFSPCRELGEEEVEGRLALRRAPARRSVSVAPRRDASCPDYLKVMRNNIESIREAFAADK